MTLFKPTYLYIKRHSITGKLYFGKTIRNPENYNGSGTKWLNHVNYHGKEYVETLWYCLFLDEKSINEFAISFSRQNDIVKSNDWLNLIEETGLGDVNKTIATRQKMSESQLGNTKRRGKTHTFEAREKNRIAHTGKKHTEQTLEKMRKHSHPHTEETKLRIKETMIGTKYEAERIMNMRIAKLNKKAKWYTNGSCTKLFTVGTEPSGWIPGRKINKV